MITEENQWLEMPEIPAAPEFRRIELKEAGVKGPKGSLFTDLFLSSFLHLFRSRIIALVNASGDMCRISLRQPAEGHVGAAPFSFDPGPKNVKMRDRRPWRPFPPIPSSDARRTT
jgi:hypothetical protein